ncbi:hypothetical protein TNIN_281051 [Trichonephila inaurata madagascariensis]|uniref:Uncharacterized protein n=1 Tax=Trichonephila inaurata madagascariensis TaxID=2747483 RepID=A0A8X6XM31_9ARAC|nr:hypothetical protein TNIN_281051 [Trichonephila inaurata madagascariensis]
MYPKPRKGTPTNTKNTYSSVINSIVRPNVSYAQAANNSAPSNTSNSNNRQQMAPLAKGNPATKTPTQASRVLAPPSQPVNANTNPNLERPFYLLNSGTANRDLTHSVNRQSYCHRITPGLSSSHTVPAVKTPVTSFPPPPLRLHYDSASQSGFWLPHPGFNFQAPLTIP